jgi:NTP pyrophosphatase (non-canonical NTP hydrolase)
MDEQQTVASFIQEHEMEAPPTYRLLDLVSELGELAKDVAESTDYGESPGDLEINSDEIGDTLFALLALADGLEIDASDALDEALTKYENRIAETQSVASGE